MEEAETKETALLSWDAPEYQDYTRNSKYYIIVTVALLGVIGYSIYTRDWYAIVVFLILAAVAYWYQQKVPQIKKYKITQLGIYQNEKINPYNEIFSFSIIINGDYRALTLVFSKKYLPELTILLDEKIDPFDLKTRLSAYIPEDTTRTESIIDRLSRLLRL